MSQVDDEHALSIGWRETISFSQVCKHPEDDKGTLAKIAKTLSTARASCTLREVEPVLEAPILAHNLPQISDRNASALQSSSSARRRAKLQRQGSRHLEELTTLMSHVQQGAPTTSVSSTHPTAVSIPQPDNAAINLPNGSTTVTAASTVVAKSPSTVSTPSVTPSRSSNLQPNATVPVTPHTPTTPTTPAASAAHPKPQPTPCTVPSVTPVSAHLKPTRKHTHVRTSSAVKTRQIEGQTVVGAAPSKVKPTLSKAEVKRRVEEKRRAAMQRKQERARVVTPPPVSRPASQPDEPLPGSQEQLARQKQNAINKRQQLKQQRAAAAAASMAAVSLAGKGNMPSLSTNASSASTKPVTKVSVTTTTATATATVTTCSAAASLTAPVAVATATSPQLDESLKERLRRKKEDALRKKELRKLKRMVGGNPASTVHM
eukprot:m.49784 g.49784  ORF g.49784 m.49784 type:complete len:432 (+) comp11121_c1_seq3:110-1405(+)